MNQHFEEPRPTQPMPAMESPEGTHEQGSFKEEGSLKEITVGQVRPMLASSKKKLVVRLHDAAGVLRETGEQLRKKNKPTSGDYAVTTARRVEDFTTYLQSKTIDELLNEVQSFVRARPWFSLGSAFMLGMAAARFLKATRSSSL